MSDEIEKFCGNCHWYDLEVDSCVAGEWCLKHRCKTSRFYVCKDHES